MTLPIFKKTFILTKINIYILFILIFIFTRNLYAGQNNVLIINTDNSVSRYKEIADEFKKILGNNEYQWQEYNLSTQDNTNELRDRIQADNIDIVFCIGTKAYSQAKDYVGNKKLIFSAAINWRRLGVDSKTFGISNELTPIQEMSLLKYLFPSVKSIGLLFNSQQSQEYVDAIKSDANTLNIKIVDYEINADTNIGSALEKILPEVDIFWIIPDPVVLESESSIQKIFESAKHFKKPIYSYSDIFIEQGAVLSVSPDIPTIGRQAANLALLMDSNKESTGKIQIPAGSSITVNKCIINELNLNLNQDALDSVNRIVECHDYNK